MKLISLLHDAACIYVRMHTYESVCQYKSFLKAIIAFKHYIVIIVATSSYIGVYIDFTLSGKNGMPVCITFVEEAFFSVSWYEYKAAPEETTIDFQHDRLRCFWEANEFLWVFRLQAKNLGHVDSLRAMQNFAKSTPACDTVSIWMKTSMKIIIICTKQNSYHPCTRLHAICSMLCWAPSNV